MPSDIALLDELSELVRETYHCWEAGWVGFTWQNYTYDHVQRVRKLALTLGRREGVDLRVLEFATLLHDITKGYDGEVITDGQGRRLLDERGFWHNELRLPVVHNRVTEIFERLGLAGQLHHESGAAVAQELLAEQGLSPTFCKRVAEVIRSHLQPDADSPPEGLVLYDADTIDANCGLPAFLRNVHIHLHFREVRAGPGEVPLDQLLRDRPRDYLDPYIRERLPTWAAGKRRDFPPRLMTEAGREMAERRLAHLEYTLRELAAELDAFEMNSHRGRLAVVLYFMRHRDNPVLSEQLTFLERQWLHLNGATSETHAFVASIRREMEGLE